MKSPLLKYINCKFGNLTVIGLDKRKNGNYFKVQCDCGNVVIKQPQTIRNGTTKTCGKQCPINHENKKQNLFDKYNHYIGTQFESSVVIALQYNKDANDTYRLYFQLRCLCGDIYLRYCHDVIAGKSINCTNLSCQFRKKKISKYIGREYYNFTIIDVKNDIFTLQCTCGDVIEYQYRHILNNSHPKCNDLNCQFSKNIKTSIAIDRHKQLIGVQQNNLLVLDFIYDDTSEHPFNYQYRCKCLSCQTTDFLIPCQQFNNFNPFHCTKCQTKSKVEILFSDFLSKHNIQFDNNHWIESKSNIQSKIEIDFMIDGQNVGIELHGLTTHATTKGDYDDPFIGNKHRTYHLNKTKSCEEQNIDLIQFWNTEWIQKPDICKSIILNRIGESYYKTYARKCVIREIDKSTYDSFMETNHLQGSTRGESVRLGLFYKENNTLVSVMSFGHSRFSGHQWEMFRFATHVYSQVIGGASKLFKYFIRNWYPTNIVSYSDRRVFNSGGLYDMLGFTLSHMSNPSYWYFKNTTSTKRLYHRSTFMKHKLKDKLATFDPNLSEWENMELNGYLRVYDCGNKVYIWE